MKKNTLIHLVWTALLGAICAVSCQTAKEVDIAGERLSYDLTVVADMAETRTANNGNSTVWVADDALTVLHIEEGGSTYFGSRFYFSGENNAFKGRVTDVADYNNWYMVYPYREDNTSAEAIHITVQPELVQTGNNSKAHLAGEGFPLYGKAVNMPRSAELNVYMSNALTVMKYIVKNTTDSPIVVKNIVIAAPDPVSGNFVGDLTNDTVEWTPDGTTSSNVTVRVENGEAIAAGADASFYAGAIPFSVAPGGQLKVKVTAVHPSAPDQEIVFYHVYNLTNGTTFNPSSIKPLNLSFDENHQNDPDGPSIKQDQTLSFANETITWTLGDTYAVGGVYDLPQDVAGAHTAVTYTSSKSEVATISDGKVRIAGVGTTTILAVAAEDDDYNAAEASFQLVIAEAAVTPTNRTYTYVAPNAITAGTYVIAGSESGELSVALFPNVETKSWTSSQGAVSNGQIIPHKVLQGLSNTATTITTEDADVIGGEVTLSASGNGWKIKVNKTGEYLVVPTQNYRISFVNEASASVFSITSGTSGAAVQSGSYYFYHSGSGEGFTFRTNSTSNTRFYKLDSSKQNQTIAFANPSVTWTLGDTYEVGGTYSLPQVSGAATTVTYTSSNTSVAQIVDGNKVKINAAGTTTITATAAETASYYGATAEMTLEIKNASAPVTGNAYVKVTSEPENWEGTYLFVDETSGKAFAAFAANASSYAVNVTISDGRIAASNELATYALTVTDAGVQHANVSGQEAYNVQNSDGKYIFYSSSAIQIQDTNTRTNSYSSSATTYYHAFKYSNGGVQVLSSGNSSGYNKYYLGYSSNAFGYDSGADTRRVQLYRLENTGDPTKLDQTLTFDYATVTETRETASGTLAVQPVRGAQTAVTYSSSDTGVATVSGTTLTITGFGTTVITATATGNSTYNGATASYTLVVNQTSSPITGSAYVKVTSEPQNWAGTYLFVDEASGKAFAAFSANASSYAVNVTISNGRIAATSDIAKYALTVTDAGEQHANASGQEAYNVRNSDGMYIYCSSNAIQIAETNSKTDSGSGWGGWGGSTSTYYYYHAFKYSNGGVQVLSSRDNSGSSKYYLGYSSNAFSYAGGSSASSSDEARRLQLYKLDGEGGTTPVDPQPGTNPTYTKATSLTVGGTYLITDVADQRLFKGAADGSYVSVSPVSGVITDANNSYAGYEFTVTQSGSKYCLIFNDGKYLVCDYSTSGNSTTGLVYETAKPADNYLYALSVSNGVFEFSTDQRNSTSTNQVLYYKTQAMGGTGADTFKIGGSGAGVGVHLYLKNGGGSTPTPGKQNQTLTFAQPSVTWSLGSGYSVGSSYPIQNVSGAQTAVTYTSSNTGVATITNGQIRIVAAGTTVITATAAENANYNSATASYTLTITPATTNPTYTKATSLTVGGTYLITDVADQRLFKGAADGSYVSVSPAGGVITDANNSYAGYEFTVTQSGSKYCLIFNDGKYLVCDYSTSGNSTTGLVYETAKPADNYLYALSVSNGVFEFSTDQRNSTSTNQVLYYKTQAMGGTGADTFKIGGSGAGVGVHLYLKNGGGSTPTPGKQNQTLTFAQPSVTWSLGSGYTVGGSYPVQTVSGAQTAVTYSSSNTGVATISGTQVRIVGSGMTTITATASGNDNYYAGSASYTLTIIPASGAMTYSIENARVEEYFNYVEQHPYDPSDYSYSYVTNYSNGTGQNNRLDWPKPVPVSWSNPTSGNGSKVVYIYNDAAMTSEELSVSVSSSSATSADVYNLIPGRTYYYKVTNNGGNTLSTGQFNTTGRRRMIKVGDSRYGQSYANNCRDLGGQVATNGKKIKFGILYRGSNMDSITEEARNCLLNYMKIGLDVDLRESTGRNPLGITVSDQTYNSMNDLTNRNKMGNTLRDIFNAVHSGKHAYIHCAVGADRTGFVCMVLEGLLGIPQNMCDVDYELTSFAGAVGTRARIDSWSSNNYYYSGSGKGVTYINDKYPSGATFQDRVILFAQDMGVTHGEIVQFQNDMLE